MVVNLSLILWSGRHARARRSVQTDGLERHTHGRWDRALGGRDGSFQLGDRSDSDDDG